MTTDTAALQIVQAARLVAVQARPYLAQALYAVTLREKPGIGTMACDAHWRVYYDPATVRAWGVQNTTVGLLHEISHLLFAHHARAKALGVTPETAKIANLAQDAAINEHLVDAGDKFSLLDTDATPAKLGLPGGQTWEAYYEALRAKQPPQQQQQQDGEKGEQGEKGQQGGEGGEGSQGESADGEGSGKGKGGGKGHGAKCKCGSGSTGVPEAWEDAPPASAGKRNPGDNDGAGDVPGMHEAEVVAIQNTVAEAVAAHEAKEGRGSARGYGAWAASKITPPQVPWQQVLRQAVRTAVQRRRGAADYSYSRPSRRASAVQGVVLPSMHESVPQIAVVLDTSASMGSQRLQAAVNEIEGVCRALSAQVRLVQVDALVQADVTVQSLSGITVKGMGGTDMNVGIRHVVASQKRKPVDAIIVVTDGDTPMPRREDVPRDVRLVYCLIAAYSTRTPEWATTVRVPLK